MIKKEGVLETVGSILLIIGVIVTVLSVVLINLAQQQITVYSGIPVDSPLFATLVFWVNLHNISIQSLTIGFVIIFIGIVMLFAIRTLRVYRLFFPKEIST
jgi:phosphatidylserine synthase